MKTPSPYGPNQKHFVVSYITLRKFIGIIGIALPIVLSIGGLMYCGELLISISDYYHTPMRNVLVGALCAVAFFMLAYKGRKTSIWWLRENLFTNIGAIFALCTAFFPTVNHCKIECAIPITYSSSLVYIFGWIHNISAVLFFLILAYFPLVLFKEKEQLIYCGNNLINVKKRNLIFKLCGYLILICIILTMIFFLYATLNNLSCIEKQRYDLVFWTEFIGLCTFGVSWLIKGQVCWKDS